MSDKDLEEYYKSLDKELRQQYIKKNFFSIYSAIISTILLIIAIINLFK